MVEDTDYQHDAGTDGVDGSADVVQQFTGQGGVVTVAGRTWAVGLVWEAVSGDKTKPMAQARASATSHYADLALSRRKTQYALGSTTVGHKRGQRSLAAALADNLEDQLLAAFEVEGGFYLVGVRDEQILPGVDLLFTDRREAEELLFNLKTGSVWRMVIAPKSWGVPDAKNETLEECLRGSRSKATLQPISRTGTLIRYSGIGVGCLVAAGVVFAYHQWSLAKDAASQQEQLRRAAMVMAAQRTKALNDIKNVVMPWTDKFYGVPAMLACQDGIEQAPSAVPGWQLVSVSCSTADGTITEQYKRAGGSINWIGPSLDKGDFHPTVSISGTGNTDATVSWPFKPDVAKYHRHEKMSDVDAVYGYLTKQFDELNAPITMKTVEPPAPKAKAKGDKSATSATPVPTFKSLEFSFTTPMRPENFVSILGPIPVILVDRVILSSKASNGGMVWEVDGKVYQEVAPPTTAPVKKPNFNFQPPNVRTPQ